MNPDVLFTQVQMRTIAVPDLLATLGVSFLIGLVIVAIYRFTHRGLTYERSFLVTLVLIGPIVGLVMLLIGSNLALSLGLIGALSIIRFRNVIRDSRDMVYLFWAIAIGLGCGTFNWAVSTIASGFIGCILVVLHLIQFGKARQSESVLVVRGTGKSPGNSISDLVTRIAAESNMRSLEVGESGWEIVYELSVPSANEQDQQRLLQEIHDVPGVQSVSLLAPNLTLPV